MSDSLWPHGLLQARILRWMAYSFSSGSPRPRNQFRSPALQADSLPTELSGKPKNTGVGSLSLLQGIVPTQGSNPGPLHCRWILYQLSHKGSPRILEWGAYPFSRGTGVSCIAGRFFTNWAMRETSYPKTDRNYISSKYAEFKVLPYMLDFKKVG